MTAIMFGKKTEFTLEKEEGLSLYNSGIGNECPGGLFSPLKKVWWIIESETIGYPYTLCQTCYHNNRFGEKDASIKEQLIPRFLQGIGCCCDGIVVNEAFPFTFGVFRVGIYSTLPKTQQLFATKQDNCLNVKTNEKKMTYVICVRYIANFESEFTGFKCKLINKNGESQNVIFTITQHDSNGFQVEILGTRDSVTSNIITPNKFKVDDSTYEDIKTIKLISADSKENTDDENVDDENADENTLLEFTVKITYDENFIRPLYPHSVIDENGQLKINNDVSNDNDSQSDNKEYDNIFIDI